MLWSIRRSSEYLEPGTSGKAFWKKGHDVGGCQCILKDKDGCLFLYIHKEVQAIVLAHVEGRREEREHGKDLVSR